MTENSSAKFPAFANYEIEVIYKIDGSTFSIKHFLKAPSAKDKIDYWRTMADREFSAKGGTFISIGDSLEASSNLWDKLVSKVEGYDFGDSADKWLELVPVEHKRSVIILLLGRAGALDKDSEKN